MITTCLPAPQTAPPSSLLLQPLQQHPNKTKISHFCVSGPRTQDASIFLVFFIFFFYILLMIYYIDYYDTTMMIGQ